MSASRILPLISFLLSVHYWQELISILSDPYVVDDKLCHISISTGITAFKGEDLTLDQLLPRAYTALQHSRDSGANETVQYHEKLTEQIKQRTLIEVYLRTALQENQLSLHYQPQYELHTGALRGFERRCFDGIIRNWVRFPNDFIPISE